MDNRGKYERVSSRASLSLRDSSEPLLLEETYFKVRRGIIKSQNGFIEVGPKGRRMFINVDNVLSLREVVSDK